MNNAIFLSVHACEGGSKLLVKRWVLVDISNECCIIIISDFSKP